MLNFNSIGNFIINTFLLSILLVFIFIYVGFTESITKSSTNIEISKIEQYKNNHRKLSILLKAAYNKEIKTKKTDPEKLIFVNDYVSTFIYQRDHNLYGKKDYWASISEFEDNLGGDCEDIAYYKYNLLLKAGIDESKLDFSTGLYKGGKHVVLRYKITTNEYLILEHHYIATEAAYQEKDFIASYSFSPLSFKIYQIFNRAYNIFTIF